MKSLNIKIILARLAVFWEQLWPALLAPLGVVGSYALLALSGIIAVLPGWAHISLLVVFGALLLWSLRALAVVRLPNREDGLRRLERTAGLAHRPATSYFDTLSATPDDETAQTLWALHKERLTQALSKLRPGLPSPKAPRHDPYALRAALLVALVAAFFLAGPDRAARLKNALKPNVGAAADQIWIDAWVTPPAYTGHAPIFLTGRPEQGAAPAIRPRTAITVPGGSVLTVRVAAAAKPELRVRPQDHKTPNHGDATIVQPLDAGANGKNVIEWRVPLTTNSTAQIRQNSQSVANWAFAVTPDQPPEISFTRQPSTSARGALTFSYRARDDYGIAAARTEIRLATPDRNVTALEPPLPVPAPDFALTLQDNRPQSATRQVHRDLTAHPWAGLDVSIALIARDQSGQSARSRTVSFKLPERTFTKPMARALIEQRRKLIATPGKRFTIAVALDALAHFPEKFIKSTAVYLGLRTSYFRLVRADGTDDLLKVVDILWDVALHIEDGDLSLAEKELRAAQDALMKALARNAPDDEISKLMSDLKKALGKYLRAMMRKNRENAQKQNGAPDQNARQIRPEDLARMLDQIEDLAKSGARDAARQMLSKLRDILENMRAGLSKQPSQSQSALSNMLRELGGLIGKQQQLMDRTFQAERGIGGKNGVQGLRGDQAKTLGEMQESLKDMLNRMMGRMGKNGVNVPGALEKAGEAMKDAARALREKAGQEATGSQGQAVDRLRQGAQSLAQQMLDGMAQRSGNNRRGRTGARGETDPLGRPRRSSGTDFGISTKVPEEIDIQRARRIMKLLRDRLGERSRPKLELDYLERLLRQF